MSALPDWDIEDLCADGWPRFWRPGSKSTNGGVRRDLPAPGETEPLDRLLSEEGAVMPPWQEIPNAGPMVEPFDPALLGPSTLDMRLGLLFESPQTLVAHLSRSGSRLKRVNPIVTPSGIFRIDGAAALGGVKDREECVVEIELAPKQVLACISAEFYRIPPHIQGKLYSRSSLAREWIDHSTATKIHPGFQGEIAFEIVNHGTASFTLRSGMRLIQIEFEYMSGVPKRPYFAIETAKYRGQRGQVHSADPGGKA